MSDKLKMHSPNLVDANIEKISALFPNCITETKDENGELKKAVDFDLLKQELSQILVEGEQERYRLDWVGKKEAILTANAPIAKTLRPCSEESVNFDNTENLFIEGDNLEALKLLQENYLGKVKMIYIDPPYNTGNDFIYEDNFAESTEVFFEKSNQVDEQGNRLIANTESNGRFHSDWLSMIYSRLKLARNLLKDDGVMFISIDDNEQENLKKICHEIFGENNFFAHVVWQKKYAATNDAKGFSNMHDHILVYRKSNLFNRNLLPRTEEQNKPYKNDDGDGRGLWRSDNLLVKSFSQTAVYPIVNPNTGKEYFPPQGSSWRANKVTMQQWLNENRIYFGKDGTGAPQLKRYLNEVQDGRVPTTWWTFEECGHNDAANKELRTLFEIKPPFDTPKPTKLLKQIIHVSTDKNDIVLDFFAGSSTTADALIQFNAEDGGNRKFIMVQLPEDTDEKSEAYNLGYKNIAEISKDRIRRAGKKILTDNAGKEGIENLDIGFRVLKIDSTNMKDVYYTPDALKQADMLDLADHIKSDRTSEDLLFQVMLDWGLELSLPIERKTIAGKEVFYVAGNSLVACFDDLTFDVVDEVAKDHPLRFVSAEKAIHLDHDKTNIKERFKQLSPDTEVKFL
ncbi:site-specific DNA-methyltransferase [Acinetobacter sp. IK22]|uniref:site-specific DNA-methyltransferase n=1 Tax=unclassified Acinetobacter TaxID=196816 RepID=UPI002652124D|nr:MULTISPECIES: site-specific DNA-methyltransferase [unclassified Acinetobacter]MDN5477879.1 site-specific DNA-methyltransferase [Chryseobacterium sp.]MEB3796969.1 site-specific DNA-methyltransferase [Acinetobacter sp. IK24]MEB3816099.1 site-specific DNA-methyltransferase [Acinetobacter sp. IK22]MEB3835356.1 site-specific DNA-methyltransferase [Acinetobacter sp. IK23]